jgi:dienelactone hydrolase
VTVELPDPAADSSHGARLTSPTDVRRLLGITRPLATMPEWTPGVAVAGPAGVVVRSLVLDSEGGPMPCLYLTPERPGPWPAVVAVHQHNDQYALGKSEPAGLAGDPEMAYGLAMARLGVAVLIPDLTAFEERRGPGPDGADGERLAAFHLLALGTTLQARHVADVSRCVSWLRAQDDVVGGIGVIGHSLGGQVAFFTAVCDERVRAAVISCGVGTLESFHAARVVHNPAWYVPGLIAAGDVPAVARVAVSTAFWVSAGAQDPIFPLAGVEQVVAALPPGSTRFTVVDGGHGFPPILADQATRWLADRVTAG